MEKGTSLISGQWRTCAWILVAVLAVHRKEISDVPFSSCTDIEPAAGARVDLVPFSDLVAESKMKKDDFGHFGACVTIIGLAIVLPIVAVLLGYWVFGISLPTLMFIAFVLLFLGSIACWPASDRQATSPELLILLVLGQASAFGVLILFFIRLFSEELLFHWI